MLILNSKASRTSYPAELASIPAFKCGHKKEASIPARLPRAGTRYCYTNLPIFCSTADRTEPLVTKDCAT